ncbi:putative T6SS immunity periplasmic lipoprotein [Dryocola sp. BD586]|uniref:putative T6SS immunity periplasmic lipoprotein n=1 Tax=Dryocola sp. BD586 TaxID=3133271 RepID=UPI003F4FB9E0
MKKIFFCLWVFLLCACQSEADKLAFANAGAAIIEANRICLSVNKRDVLSYYYLSSSEDGYRKSILMSGHHPLHLSYPDTCIKVALKPGYKYGLLYTMNNIDYRYEFFIDLNGVVTGL